MGLLWNNIGYMPRQLKAHVNVDFIDLVLFCNFLKGSGD